MEYEFKLLNGLSVPFSKFCLGMCEWTLYVNHTRYAYTDKTQPISASHSPSSSRTRTSTSTLLSECLSTFVC